MNRLPSILGFVLIGLIIACGCTGQTPPGPPVTPSPTVPATTGATPSPTVPVTTPPTTQTTTGQGGTASVEIQNFAFVPANLAVTRGTSVTWVNQDSASHTVVSDAFGQTAQGAYFRSNSLSKGSVYSFTFADAGTYQYHCGVHPSMRGTVTVT
ncbi:MAG: plastocyanin/azurin family copper-binding protein [Methanomicrobiales archaeon]|nr:plastocyanin/azurin family copper-binding protein [Methanomicrobiales archaeon]